VERGSSIVNEQKSRSFVAAIIWPIRGPHYFIVITSWGLKNLLTYGGFYAIIYQSHITTTSCQEVCRHSRASGLHRHFHSCPHLFTYGAQILVLADTALFVGIAEAEDNTPRIFAIYQNYPNPFNLTTLIKYQLPTNSKLSLKVYNVAGQEVCTLVDERQKPGYYTVQWNGRDNNNRTVASGIYFYRLEAGNFNDTKKLILLR